MQYSTSGGFNLPPGCRLSDIDPLAVCPRCEGYGLITAYNLTTQTDSEEIICPRCDGLGTLEREGDSSN